MEHITDRSPNFSRAIVIGLLEKCLFTINGKNCSGCPLKELRNNLTSEKKYEFAMSLTDSEIEKILAQHEYCYEKKFTDLHMW